MRSSRLSQHLLLATMFALNFCYQPVDLVLIIQCDILEILSMLTNNSCALMNQGWLAASTSGSMLLSGAVKLACARLLQILTVAARGNEGTCIGVSRWPVRDHNHHTTTDMWLYRAYSLTPQHTETEENKEDKDVSGEEAKKPAGHRQTLSEAKLTALCTEVWPALAVIGGVDSGLRAGGLCLHKPSGVKPSVLLDLICLMRVLEEDGWQGAYLPPRRKYSEELLKEEEKQCYLNEDISDSGTRLSENERKKLKEPKVGTDSFPSPRPSTQTADPEELSCIAQPIQASQTLKMDAFALEMRAVRVSYLLIGGLKCLTVFFTCEKLSDLLLASKHDPPNSPSIPLHSPIPDQAKAKCEQWDEDAELRSVLQYVVQSMVKWAVRPYPIKQTVSLADLERAQVMIYKGALGRLQDDKERKGI
ncbi:hypothetical protein GOODEAATRI_001727 [Goodea atripinnis]|uniref:Uncharacterized protein n=1 Tax=Goodea atripinnis TaxID=208336 RepID=A0ABV0PUF1_9TELE